MSTPSDQATYRTVSYIRKGDLSKTYQCTYVLIDDHLQEVLAACDISGRITSAPVSIMDQNNQAWQMRSNRKYLPSRWILTDPGQAIAMQFERNIRRKLSNPLDKNLLSLLDGQGRERYSVIDPREVIADRILAVSPDEWLCMDGDQVAAKIGWLMREKTESTGLFGHLRDCIVPTDRGMVSSGSSHVLAAPIALALLMIMDELRASARSGNH